MKPIDPAELSAYLDGELSPQRKLDVERALQADSALREELRSLTQLDTRLRRVAAEVRPVPPVQLDFETTMPKRAVAIMAVTVALLVAFRLIPKLLDADLLGSMLANAIVFALLLAGIGVFMRTEAKAQSVWQRQA